MRCDSKPLALRSTTFELLLALVQAGEGVETERPDDAHGADRLEYGSRSCHITDNCFCKYMHMDIAALSTVRWSTAICELTRQFDQTS